MQPYYEHGGITIYHGDCRAILPELELDLVLTDPPYGVGFKYAEYNDADRIGYCRLIGDVLNILHDRSARVVLTTGRTWLWTFPPPDGLFCWFKPGSVRQSPMGTLAEWEPILFYGRLTPNDRRGSDVIRLPACPYHSKDIASLHPCPKPLRLYTALLQRFQSETPVVDPFMGSGTTLRAAKDLGRHAIGIEIEERYCEIAAQRMAQEVLALDF